MGSPYKTGVPATDVEPRIPGISRVEVSRGIAKEGITFMNKKDFKPGEYVVYVNGDTYQIGRVKRLNSRGAFVFYHAGDTPASTPFDNLFKLENGYCITESIFPYQEQTEE